MTKNSVGRAASLTLESPSVLVKSRSTGLAYTIHEVRGDLVMVRDDNGKLINHYFDKDSFIMGKAQ